MCRASFPYLKQSHGVIINLSATLHYLATPWQSHPSAAKAGVDSLTRSLAGEWGEFGIRVNGIAPGPIKDTEAMIRLMPGISSEEKEKLVSSTVPLGRMGTVEDIGFSALFLSSSASSYITGCTMVVDGGYWMAQKPLISREQLTFMQQQRKQQSKL